MLRFGRWFGWLSGNRSSAVAPDLPPLDVTAIHKEHADFVYRALQWLGVRPADLPDVSQEVFVRVHLRLHTFDRTRSIRAWLFGICRKLADHYRRRAYMRRELQMPDIPEANSEDVSPNPEDCVERLQTRARLETLLDELKPIHRAVLVMREFDEMECHEIAEVLDVPEGPIDNTYAVYECLADGSASYDCAFSDILSVGSKSPKGDSKWGQSDLAGSVYEWNLDCSPNYPVVCKNCAQLQCGIGRVMRGGGWGYGKAAQTTMNRYSGFPSSRSTGTGARCARNP